MPAPRIGSEWPDLTEGERTTRSGAEEVIDKWKQDLDEARDETTGSALARSDQVEEELFEQLTSVREQLESIAESRRALDVFVTGAIAAGYADAE